MCICKKHIYFLFLSPILVLLLTGNKVANNPNIYGNGNQTKIIQVNPCPDATPNTKGFLKEFLTESQWSSERRETNTNHLNPSQIVLLDNEKDKTACKKFNNQFQEAITEEWESGGETYNIGYYKAGNFYFVIILLRRPNNPDVAASGVDYLTIYDDKLNIVKGYAF